MLNKLEVIHVMISPVITEYVKVSYSKNLLKIYSNVLYLTNLLYFDSVRNFKTS